MIVVGVGNEFRKDDAIGLLVARALQEMDLPHVTVVESTGEGTHLLQLFGEGDAVVIIDAVASDAETGHVHCFDARLSPLPVQFFLHSSHAFSVAEAIELAREFRRLPESLVVYGVEGRDFGFGDALSPQLAEKMPQIIAHIQREILKDCLSEQT